MSRATGQDARDAQATLRESEARFRSIFENAAVGMAHISKTGEWLELNQRICDLLGYTRDELQQLRFQDITHPEDLDTDLVLMREALENKRDTYEMEKRYIRKDGSVVWANLTVGCVRKPDHSVDYFISVLQDITERRKVSEALRESEERFRAVQQTMPDGFMMYRAIRDEAGDVEDFECIYANPAASEIASLPGVPFTGRWVIRDTAPEYRVGVSNIYKRVFQTGIPEQGETLLLEPGEERWARYSVVKVDDGVAISFSDITERIRTETALRESEARFRAVQQTMPDGFTMYRAIRDEAGFIKDFECIYANPAASEIASIPGVSLFGRRLVRDTAPEHRVGIRDVYKRIVETGVPEQGETRLLEPGEERWVRYSVMKLDDGVAVSFSDITNRIRAEIALQESEARFRAVQQTSPDGFMILKSLRDRNDQITDFGFVYVNPTLERIAGDTAQNIIGSTLRMRMPGTVLMDAVDHYIRTVETGEPWRGDILYPRTGGGRWYRAAIVRVDDGVAVSFADVTDAKRAEILLEARDQRLRTILNNLMAFVGLLSPEGIVLEVNDTALGLSGLRRSDVIGKYYWESPWISHSLDAQEKVRAAIARARRGRRVRFDLEIRSANDERATIDLQFSPIFDEHRNVVEIVPSAVDISDRVKSEQQREMLVNELSHRVKNSLATVQTIASHTLRDATDLESFRTAFVGRLMAISKCHDLLVDATRRTADLSQLVRDQVLPYARAGAGSQVSVSGPPLVLGPEASHTFGLILHELATNAAKYGALSNEDGHLSIKWKRGSSPDGAEIMVTWEETGGPPVSPPERRGFGSVLIEQSLAYSLGGKAEIEYRPEGLLARFRFRKLG
jgi:PAS domain S-box-containing protein